LLICTGKKKEWTHNRRYPPDRRPLAVLLDVVETAFIGIAITKGDETRKFERLEGVGLS
jgi:hypothetical protein